MKVYTHPSPPGKERALFDGNRMKTSRPFRDAHRTGTSRQKSRKTDRLPYRSRGRLLSRGEMAFFRALRTAVGREYLISFKVRAADLISCGQKSWEDGFGHMIARHHLDFALCERRSSDILAAIELDDRSHDRPSRRRRDEFLDRAFAAASIPLIRFRAAAHYDFLAIAASIAGVLNGTQQTGRPSTFTVNATRPSRV